MRSVTLGLAFVFVVIGLGPVLHAQEPAPWLAVQNCAIKPTEGADLRAALQEFIDYISANPVTLPGNVYGAFRQRVNDTANYSLAVEVQSVAEWGAWQSARLEANRSDQRRGALYGNVLSHFVPQSCNWSFHQRWP